MILCALLLLKSNNILHDTAQEWIAKIIIRLLTVFEWETTKGKKKVVWCNRDHPLTIHLSKNLTMSTSSNVMFEAILKR